MEQVFLPILIGCTSAAAYLVGAKGSRLSGSVLSRAVGRMLECVGLTTVFLVVNVTAGMAVILGARLLAWKFVSLYLVADPTILGFSLVQAITFQWWQELSTRSPR